MLNVIYVFYLFPRLVHNVKLGLGIQRIFIFFRMFPTRSGPGHARAKQNRTDYFPSRELLSFSTKNARVVISRVFHTVRTNNKKVSSCNFMTCSLFGGHCTWIILLLILNYQRAPASISDIIIVLVFCLTNNKYDFLMSILNFSSAYFA